MNSMQIFSNPALGRIRAIMVDDQPFFAGIDVAALLGYHNPSAAVRAHVSSSDKRKVMLPTADAQNAHLLNRTSTIIINESGLYSLVLFSRLPEADSFRHWVTAEVLPSLRRDGIYVVQHSAPLLPEVQRKVDFFDAVAASNDCITVSQLAKLITQSGFRIGQKRLFAFLRENHFLGCRGEFYNFPLQSAMEHDLFRVQQSVFHASDGSIHISAVTRVTPRGQIYFINLFQKITK